MADIFISYSQREPEPTVKLANELEARGYSVWWDNNLVPGESFRKVILRELNTAKAVIVIWTPSSVKSDWAISEADRARSARKLIPLRLPSINYGDIPPPFNQLHTEKVDDLERILKSLTALGAPPPSPVVGSSAHSRRGTDTEPKEPQQSKSTTPPPSSSSARKSDSADVFISYKSERRHAAQHVAEIVTHHGYSVWYDYALIKGRDFPQQIEKQIRGAKALVVLWCSRSVHAKWVREEVDLAEELGILVPAKIEACALPFGNRRTDYVDLQSWDGSPRSHVLDPLLEEVAKLVGRRPKPDYDKLREYDATWRRFGALTHAGFPLVEPLEKSEGDRPIGNRLQITCPKCSQELRVPAGRVGPVKCPQCGARFEADTR
jgi:hypothetical protein